MKKLLDLFTPIRFLIGFPFLASLTYFIYSITNTTYTYVCGIPRLDTQGRKLYTSLNEFVGAFALVSLLYILIGVLGFVVSIFRKKTAKQTKTFAKKMLITGVFGFIISLGLFFVVSMIDNFFGLSHLTFSCLPPIN